MGILVYLMAIIAESLVEVGKRGQKKVVCGKRGVKNNGMWVSCSDKKWDVG